MRATVCLVMWAWAVAPALLTTLPAAQRDKARPVDLPTGARVAVVAMNSKGGSQVDTVVADMLTSALRRNGWRVLERQELGEVLREQQLVRSGDVDPETAVQAGKLVGAQYLIGAKATEFGVRDTRHGGLFGLGPFGGLQIRSATGRVVLDARVIDVRTGEVLGTATAEGKIVNYGGTLFGGSWVGGSITLGGVDVNSKEWSESLLGRAARRAVDDVLQRLVNAGVTLAGRILAVMDGGLCVVGLGTNDGLREGDDLELVALRTVRDRAGQAVWTEEERVGLLTVTEARSDRSKAKVAEGDPPTEDHLVRVPRRRDGGRRPKR